MQRGNVTDYAEMTIGHLSFGLYYRYRYWQRKQHAHDPETEESYRYRMKT